MADDARCGRRGDIDRGGARGCWPFPAARQLDAEGAPPAMDAEDPKSDCDRCAARGCAGSGTAFSFASEKSNGGTRRNGSSIAFAASPVGSSKGGESMERASRMKMPRIWFGRS